MSPAVAQATDVPSEKPPPSNGAPEDRAELLEPEQAEFPTGGTVEPDWRVKGEVPPMSGGCGTPGAMI